MAVSTFTVIYNRSAVPGRVPDGQTQFMTAAQAKAAHKNLKNEPISIIGPVEQAKIVQVIAEDAIAAATAVRVLLGAVDSEGELEVFASSSIEKKNTR